MDTREAKWQLRGTNTRSGKAELVLTRLPHSTEFGELKGGAGHEWDIRLGGARGDQHNVPVIKPTGAARTKNSSTEHYGHLLHTVASSQPAWTCSAQLYLNGHGPKNPSKLV